MDDARVWDFETALWKGDPERYRASIDEACLMVVPAEPFVMEGDQAIEAMASTPRWSDVAFSEQRIVRPEQGLIVLAYRVHAERGDTAPYEAYCTSTYRRLGPDEWRVVQHQQMLPPKVRLGTERGEAGPDMMVP